MKNAILSITKIMLILSLSLCLFLPTHFSYAEELTPDNYGTPGDITGADYDTAFIKKYGGNLSQFFFGIAVIVAVIATMAVGVKYITAGVTQKADFKKDLIPMATGVILIVFINTILGIIARLAVSI